MTQPIKALVLDANSIGGGEPNLDVLKPWAAACAEHGVELWVPQVVAWELAEHVRAVMKGMSETVATHNRARRKWGIELMDEPDVVEVDAIVDLIEQVGIVIVPLDGESAIAAVRDQVLQTGAGSVKSRVKAGAADSAWLRSVYAHNDDTFDGLILVTADKGALKAAWELSADVAPRTAANLKELGELLPNDRQTATDAQAQTFLATIQAKIETPEDLYYLADLGPRNWWSPGALAGEFHFDWEQQDTGVAEVREVEMAGPASYEAWSDSVSGHVRVPVAIEEQYARQEASGDAPEYLFVTYNGSLVFDATVYLNTSRDVQATLDDDLPVVEMAVEDDTLDQRLF